MLASLQQSIKRHSVVEGLLQHFIHSQSSKPRRVEQQDKKHTGVKEKRQQRRVANHGLRMWKVAAEADLAFCTQVHQALYTSGGGSSNGSDAGWRSMWSKYRSRRKQRQRDTTWGRARQKASRGGDEDLSGLEDLWAEIMNHGNRGDGGFTWSEREQTQQQRQQRGQSRQWTFAGFPFEFMWDAQAPKPGSADTGSARQQQRAQRQQQRQQQQRDAQDTRTPHQVLRRHLNALGLPAATAVDSPDVRQAYLKSAREWHPDRHAGVGKGAAEERFKGIQHAYHSLCTYVRTKRLPDGD